MNLFKKIFLRNILRFFVIFILLVDLNLEAAYGALASNDSVSMRCFQKGKNILIVYSNVPGAVPSGFYKIRVRSKATNMQWQPVFANITQSLYSQAKIPKQGSGDASMENYQKHLKDWSHTYGNIEMNGAVEVEISKADGRPIKTAATHPQIRAGKAEVKNGKAYFTLQHPALITVDIDGQMDDQNTGQGYSGPPINTVSLFAHPIFDKPVLGDPGVYEVKAGCKPPTDPKTYSVLFFSAGVHNVGRNFKVFENKQYYIAGDAIVYGTFNNLKNGSGDNIKIFGVGTISGDKIRHPGYDPDAKDINLSEEEKSKAYTEWKSIDIDNGTNVVVEGICVANPAFHAIHLTPPKSENKANPQKVTFARWAKVISWRANGDGIGSAHVVEDCFLRCADDCTYMKGDRRRCVFWKDVNAAVFHMSGIPENFPIVIEDCDIIYLRHKSPGSGMGGVFVERGAGQPGLHQVNVLIRNIRIEDKYPSCAIFSLFSKADSVAGKKLFADKGQIGSSYSGITFQNITAAAPSYLGRTNILRGCKEAPWSGGISFDNVVIGGTKILSLDDFTTNEFVSGIIFK